MPEPASAARAPSLLRADARLRIEPNVCLPARLPTIGCERCATACPTGALRPGAHGPQLAAGCVDCGRCAVACPTGALVVPGFDLHTPLPTPLPAPANGPIALDCWRVPLAESPRGALRVPCLGGLAIGALVDLVERAVGWPVALLDRGLCADCPANGQRDAATSPVPLRSSPPTAGPAVREAAPPTPLSPFAGAGPLADAHRLLLALGLAPATWPQRVSLPLPPTRVANPAPEPLLEGRLSRRALLTDWFTDGTSALAPRTASDASAPTPGVHRPPAAGRPAPDRDRLIAALRRLATAHVMTPDRPGVQPAPGTPTGLLPQLTASDACADHRVCAAACPVGALTGYRDTDADGDDAGPPPVALAGVGVRGLRFDPTHCVGCGACVALCPQQALTLDAELLSLADAGAYSLTRHVVHVCPDCGAEHRGDGPRCPPCAADQDFARSAFALFTGGRGNELPAEHRPP